MESTDNGHDLNDIEWDNWGDDEEGKTATSQYNVESCEDDGHGGVVPSPESAHIEVLRSRFGHSKFRPTQWRIIRSIIKDRRDNCVVMATGYGKSLTYQFPAVFSVGLSVVVSPLISLMEDQVLSLQMSNIPACFLGSAQNEKEKSTDQLFAGQIRVLYVTPEFCAGDYGREMLLALNRSLGITLVAIDEAHCVSQWGHDFRSSYRKLGSLRKALPSVPFLAVTATATPAICRDICTSLHLKNPSIVCTGFDRPNLHLSVSMRSDDVMADLRKFMVQGGERSLRFEGPTIIYCQTQKSAENVDSILRSNNINSECYHAGRGIATRRKVHEAFVRDQIQVVVATVAFGMGIDKPDVRCVIHYGAPKDIESYYQEVGRAGRDGLPAVCHVFYAHSDFRVNRYFLKDLVGGFRTHREQMIDLMESYLESTACRRRLLLSHFEGGNVEPNKELAENCCDNCTQRIKRQRYQDPAEANILDSSGLYDFTEDAALLLEAVRVCNGRFGISTAILLLRGSNSAKLTSAKLNQSAVHGKGKVKSEAWWKGIGRLLTKHKYLESHVMNQHFHQKQSGFVQPCIELSNTGRQLLYKLSDNKSECRVRLEPSNELLTLIKAKRRPQGAADSDSASTSTCVPVILPPLRENDQQQVELYRSLVQLRNSMAQSMACAPFHLASNQAMIEMSIQRPSNPKLLAEVDGFTEGKIARDGETWINHIVTFCKERGLETTDTLTQNEDDSNYQRLVCTLTPTERETYQRFHVSQMTVSSIAAERNMVESTIISHLSSALKKGLPVNLERAGVGSVILEEVTKVIRSPPINSDVSRLQPVKDLCPDYITYGHVKLVVAHLTKQLMPLETENKTPAFKPRENSFVSSLAAVRSQRTLNEMLARPKPALHNLSQPKLETGVLENDSPATMSSNLFCNEEDELAAAIAASLEECSDEQKNHASTEDEEAAVAAALEWEDDDIFENLEENQHAITPSEDCGLKRSSSSIESMRHPELTDSGPLKRSSSLLSENELNVKFEGGIKDTATAPNSTSKRKMPGWLSKPTAQLEVRKKLKQNSLFRT